MIYQIKEKFWSLGNSFRIQNEQGHDGYQVQGKAFSWGDQLSFQDLQGRELAQISQELFSFQPRYTIKIQGQERAQVLKEWSWFQKRFSLDVPGPNDYQIEGSFWEHNFQFTRSGQVVADISKEYFSFSDRYGVSIVNGEEDILILCTCIVIDQVLHDEQSTH